MSSKGGKGEERRRRRTMHLSWGRLGLRCQMHAVETCTHQTKIIKNKLRINLKLIREVDPSDGEKRVLRMLEKGESKEKKRGGRKRETSEAEAAAILSVKWRKKRETGKREAGRKAVREKTCVGGQEADASRKEEVGGTSPKRSRDK